MVDNVCGQCRLCMSLQWPEHVIRTSTIQIYVFPLSWLLMQYNWNQILCRWRLKNYKSNINYSSKHSQMFRKTCLGWPGKLSLTLYHEPSLNMALLNFGSLSSNLHKILIKYHNLISSLVIFHGLQPVFIHHIAQMFKSPALLWTAMLVCSTIKRNHISMPFTKLSTQPTPPGFSWEVREELDNQKKKKK